MQHYDEQICGGEVRQKGKWEQFVLCEERWYWRREDSKDCPDERPELLLEAMVLSGPVLLQRAMALL